jgi:predicted exporter
MEQYDVAKLALTQRAEAERLYTNYALLLASTFALLGVGLIIAGLGDHLDILVQGSGMEARFVNASPGVVLWLLSSVLFWMAKPKRLRANVLHTTPAQEAEHFFKFIEDAEARVKAEQAT